MVPAGSDGHVEMSSELDQLTLDTVDELTESGRIGELPDYEAQISSCPTRAD